MNRSFKPASSARTNYWSRGLALVLTAGFLKGEASYGAASAETVVKVVKVVPNIMLS
jgi:hypothetical protein